MVELAVVIPTFNEKDDVLELTSRLEKVLQGLKWEIVFVDDDSPDGTSDVVRNLTQVKPNVRCMQRIGRRGLSRAVVEGILATSAPFIAVMDADFQHDEILLPKMLQKVRDENLDIVVGSRYCAGGSVGQWDSKRAAMSRLATALSQLIVDKKSGHIQPARFILFCCVGFSGLFVHFLCLWGSHRLFAIDFAISQTIATLVAVTSNYTLNNLLTYRDRRRRGLRFLTGLLSFYLICGIGVIANVGVASFVFHRDYTWWLAGGAGALVGTVWNYAASSIFTWGRR